MIVDESRKIEYGQFLEDCNLWCALKRVELMRKDRRQGTRTCRISGVAHMRSGTDHHSNAKREREKKEQRSNEDIWKDQSLFTYHSLNERTVQFLLKLAFNCFTQVPLMKVIIHHLAFTLDNGKFA